jgi:16S rRNA (cytidine1402-2'-O)-methyltransferase
MLYIVGTPIGNLEDITYRAVRILEEVDFVLAEDTRQSGKLLKHYGIENTLKSFHSHSSDSKTLSVIEELKNGASAALISDAGTPGISDPGFKLIQAALEAGVELVPVPGPSAVVTALSVAGVPIDKFVFLGFLPVKKGRKTLLESLKEEKRTLVMYESVHRIVKTLENLLQELGDRQVCVGREMTKLYEEYFRGKLSEAISHFSKEKPKGEFTIVVAPDNFNLS